MIAGTVIEFDWVHDNGTENLRGSVMDSVLIKSVGDTLENLVETHYLVKISKPVMMDKKEERILLVHPTLITFIK